MIAKLLLITLSTFIFGSQDSIPADTTEIEVRSIEAETLDALTNKPVFDYNEVPTNPDSLWSRIQRWLFQTIAYLMDNPWTSVAIRFIFFAVFGIVLIAIINQILGGNLGSAFSDKKPDEKISLNISEEQLQKHNYDNLLKSALSNNKYDEAVRILYLKALKELASAGIITLKTDKTNSDYKNDMTGNPAQTHFNRLTHYYEYVEYGDFEIDEQGYRTVHKVYQQINTSNK